MVVHSCVWALQGFTLVDFSASLEPFLSLQLYEIIQCIYNEDSRQTDRWTSVSP